MSLTLAKTPIGLMLPIRSGNVSGYFDQSTDTFTAYRMNIINLLRTSPGERRMNPTFGCRLWNVVFEPNDSFIASRIENIIKEDISQWIPGVHVNSVNVKHFEDDTSIDLKDIYKLYIIVKFTVTTISQEDTIEIVLNKNKV